MHLVVTVPKWFWPEWIAEGDPAGELWSGTEWGFRMGGNKPPICPGEKLYIVAFDKLRGFAPVTRIVHEHGKWVICREGGAQAVTIDTPIPGFRGFRKVWWRPEDEKPFPDWKSDGVVMPRRALPKTPDQTRSFL